jgi:hypothetical protein
VGVVSDDLRDTLARGAPPGAHTSYYGDPVTVSSYADFEREFGPPPSYTVGRYGGTYSITRGPAMKWWERPRRLWRWLRGYDILPPPRVGFPVIEDPYVSPDSWYIFEPKTSGSSISRRRSPFRDATYVAAHRQERLYRKLFHQGYVGVHDWEWPERGRYAPSPELLDAVGRQRCRLLRTNEGLRELRACGCPEDPRGPLFTRHDDDCPRRPLAWLEEFDRGEGS